MQISRVRSFSRYAAQTLALPGQSGHVLAAFRNACTLETSAGQIVSLVAPEIGNGPLNVVLDVLPSQDLAAGTVWQVRDHHLTVSSADRRRPLLYVDLAAAHPWDARPDWQALGGAQKAIYARQAELAALVAHHAPPSSQAQTPASAQARDRFLLSHASGSTLALTAALDGLCGAGPGLTPSGDDWLCGFLVASWLEGPPHSLGHRIVASALSRTTRLSHAFLERAAAGEVAEDWHTLLHGLANFPVAITMTAGQSESVHPNAHHGLKGAVCAVLRHGATSGAEMLAGFLAGLTRGRSKACTYRLVLSPPNTMTPSN